MWGLRALGCLASQSARRSTTRMVSLSRRASRWARSMVAMLRAFAWARAASSCWMRCLSRFVSAARWGEAGTMTMGWRRLVARCPISERPGRSVVRVRVCMGGVFAGDAAGSLGSGCGMRVCDAPDVEGNACVVVYAREMRFCQAIIYAVDENERLWWSCGDENSIPFSALRCLRFGAGIVWRACLLCDPA